MNSATISPIEYLVPQTSKSNRLRSVTLTNGLVALLICDIDIEATGVCMTVNSGANNNGGIQGLAHLVEHLLFSGSKRFPMPYHLIDQVLKVNGKINANTSHSYTNYHFEIPMNSLTTTTGGERENESVLNHVLQVFSDMFKQPLFKSRMIQREIDEINEEHLANTQSIEKQFYHCLKLTSNLSSSFSSFATGNSETLRNIPKIRTLLLDYFEKYYHSENLKLVVKSPLSLNHLQKLVILYFSDIPIGNRSRVSLEPIFQRRNMNIFLHAKSLSGLAKMRIVFPLSQLNDNIIQISRFLVDIIGQEGPGSLCECLLTSGLVTETTVFDQFLDTSSLVLVIELSLTAPGRNSLPLILNLVHQYMKLLALADRDRIQTLFNQFVAFENFNFNYQDSNDSLLDDVATLGERLQLLNPRYIYFGYKPVLDISSSFILTECKKLLAMEYATCILISSTFNDLNIGRSETRTLHDIYYNFDYQIFLLHTNSIASFNNPIKLLLPMPNKFLTKKLMNQNIATYSEKSQSLLLDIRLKTDLKPQLIEYSKSFELWYKRDLNNNSKVFCSFQLISCYLPLTCFNLVSIELLCGILSEEIKKDLVSTANFGFTWSMFSTLNSTNSICFNLNGIRAMYKEFLKLFVQKIKHCLDVIGDTPYSTFRRSRVKLRKDYEQITLADPFRRCVAGNMLLSEENIFSIEQRIETLSLLTIESIAQTAQTFLRSVYTSIFANGDIDIDHVYLVSYILNTLTRHLEPSGRSDIKLPSTFHPIRGKYIFELDVAQTKTNFCYFYINLGLRDNKYVRVLSRIIEYLIDLNLNSINSERVIGYKKLSGLRIFRMTIGVFIYIESNDLSCQLILAHIENFLHNICTEVENMVPSLIVKLLKACEDFSNKDKRLSPNYVFEVIPEYCSANFTNVSNAYYKHKSFWEKIINRNYRFEGKYGNEAVDKHILHQVTKADLVKYLQEVLSPYSEIRSALVMIKRSEFSISWERIAQYAEEHNLCLTTDDREILLNINDWDFLTSYILSRRGIKNRLTRFLQSSKTSQYKSVQVQRKIDVEQYHRNCKVIDNSKHHRRALNKYILA